MKRIIQTLASITIAVAATSSLANNWQWQLEQIKTEQPHHAKIAATEQGRIVLAKADDAKNVAAMQEGKPTPSSPAK